MKIEAALRRTGNRGRTTVDRLERFQAECSVRDDALRLSWTATNGQRNDLECPLTPDFRKALAEALGAPKVEEERGQ